MGRLNAEYRVFLLETYWRGQLNKSENRDLKSMAKFS